MSAFEIKECRELSKAKSEIGKTTKAFENAKNSEVNTPRHIPTINEAYEGKVYPGTNVEYRRRVFKVNGEKVEGVFPQFESKFDVMLPPSMREASDMDQFKFCTKRLEKRIEADSEFAKKFTPRQLEQIKNGEPRIAGLTWHHNERPGHMQLVSQTEHNICRHTGGRNIWGGGSGNR